MGWGQGIGIGWPNASAYSVPPNPEFTRYIISDCVFGGDYNSTNYAYNDFQINDRVIFTYNGINSFGKIIARTTEITQEISIESVGVNSADCFNNTLNFTSEVFLNDTVINIKFYCNPETEKFVYDRHSDSYLIYDYNLNIYYQGFDDEGSPVSDTFNIVGQSAEIGGYNFIPGQDNFVFEINENTGDTLTNAYIDYGQEQPSFGATTQYSDNNGCSYNYFLRTGDGYSYNANFRTDNC